MRAYFRDFEELLVAGMRGWHEGSDLLGKKSGIDTWQEDILISSGRYGGASGAAGGQVLFGRVS